MDETHNKTYVINDDITSKVLGPLIIGIGGITDTIKKVPNSQERTNEPALHKAKQLMVKILRRIVVIKLSYCDYLYQHGDNICAYKNCRAMV